MKKLLFMAFISVSAGLFSCEGTYVVSDRPVRPAYERPLSPGVGYIWIDGDWGYQGNRYIWHEGRWDRPHGNRHWQSGDWQRKGNGYTWRKGRWSR